MFFTVPPPASSTSDFFQSYPPQPFDLSHEDEAVRYEQLVLRTEFRATQSRLHGAPRICNLLLQAIDTPSGYFF